MSDSVRPNRRQPTRLLRPWESPGKNTAVGCHFLLQCRKVKSEREVAQSCPTLSDPMDCSLPRSSVHGIFQARVLEWGAIAFSYSLMSRLTGLWVFSLCFGALSGLSAVSIGTDALRSSSVYLFIWLFIYILYVNMVNVISSFLSSVSHPREILKQKLSDLDSSYNHVVTLGCFKL